MSQENVEIVQRLGWDGVDVLKLFTDRAAPEWDEMESVVEPGCVFAWIAHGQRREVTGLDEARAVFLDLWAPWEGVRTEVDQIIPRGDRVLVLWRAQFRMAGSETEVEMVSATVVLVQEGRISLVEQYARRAEALEAVGLRE